jgi:hypothetical protein
MPAWLRQPAIVEEAQCEKHPVMAKVQQMQRDDIDRENLVVDEDLWWENRVVENAFVSGIERYMVDHFSGSPR